MMSEIQHLEWFLAPRGLSGNMNEREDKKVQRNLLDCLFVHSFIHCSLHSASILWEYDSEHRQTKGTPSRNSLFKESSLTFTNVKGETDARYEEKGYGVCYKVLYTWMI